MKTYNELIKKVLWEGSKKQGRNGETISLFNVQFIHNLAEGFPLLTNKKMPWKSILAEFLWILSGENHIRNLTKKTKIWDEFADEYGMIESPYGYYIKNYPTTKPGLVIDQLDMIISMLKKDSNTRRAVMTSWHPQNALLSKLPPCHFAYVFNAVDGKLNLHITQRSGDLALGIPFDIAIFSLLLIIVSYFTNLIPGQVAISIIDAHIYIEHASDLIDQINRIPYGLPAVKFDPYTPERIKTINNLTEDDFDLINYTSHPSIKYDLII